MPTPVSRTGRPHACGQRRLPHVDPGDPFEYQFHRDPLLSVARGPRGPRRPESSPPGHRPTCSQQRSTDTREPRAIHPFGRSRTSVCRRRRATPDSHPTATPTPRRRNRYTSGIIGRISSAETRQHACQCECGCIAAGGGWIGIVRCLAHSMRSILGDSSNSPVRVAGRSRNRRKSGRVVRFRAGGCGSIGHARQAEMLSLQSLPSGD
jgi:hypothetical protein